MVACFLLALGQFELQTVEILLFGGTENGRVALTSFFSFSFFTKDARQTFSILAKNDISAAC